MRDLEQRVRTAKANVEAMVGIMSKWSDAPLYRRKDDKKDVFLNLDVRACELLCIFDMHNRMRIDVAVKHFCPRVCLFFTFFVSGSRGYSKGTL